MINNKLYKRSISSVFQCCVSSEEGRNILYDIHGRDYGHHAGTRSLVAKEMRHGFYWLTAHADAVDIVRHCTGCQRYANQMHVPSSALKTIPITWPFAVWGLNMVGQFKRAPGGHTHLLMVVNKFTKWIEDKAITKCDEKIATKFIHELIYRYGFPHSVITDNGTNFIRLEVASVAHPESND
jgi:hypothetical protein